MNGSTVLDALAFHADSRPGAMAVRDASGSINYAELVDQARRLASALRTAGVRRGDLVAIHLPRDRHLVTALLATWMAGAAWVPLDPEHPAGRTAAVLERARVRWVLGDVGLPGPWTSLSPSDLTQDAAADEPAVPGGDDLAYVIFTSGSTGAPKGVKVTHEAIAQLARSCAGVLELRPDDLFSCVHSAAFDFSVWELVVPLVVGAGALVLEREVARDPDRLWRAVIDGGVSVLSQTPAAFAALIDTLGPSDGQRMSSSRLRTVVLGGDTLVVERLRRWFALAERVPTVVNMYGITEVTVHATWRVVVPADLDSDLPGSPIGHALPGYEVRVRDASGRQAAAGQPGELYVRGTGVAAGYLDDPLLTEQRFLPEVGYRTGDRGVEVDGQLFFLGRLDRQVKIDGHRIEPAEIEHHLRAHPFVHEAAVVDIHVDGRTLLHAFVVGGPGLTVTDVLAHVRARAVAAAVPARVEVLGQLPLSANGKVDHAALRAQVTARAVAAAKVVPQPTSTTADVVRAAFARVLGHDEIADHVGIFDLGGTSLSIVRVATLLSRELNVRLSVRAVMSAPTVRGVARAVDGLRDGGS